MHYKTAQFSHKSTIVIKSLGYYQFSVMGIRISWYY